MRCTQGGQTEKWQKHSPPMTATNKGHIKTGRKTMIYGLSLMRLLSVHPYDPSPSVHHRLPSCSLLLFFLYLVVPFVPRLRLLREDSPFERR